ncbi:MAG: ATP-binding cassette domain-containing protein [Propioniciclava sp.]|uniref:ABC transporter ATP-binding protein n=1 Tax=Propioniciclava sp. TaxID=2038686 RepID=UPI0039E7102E
MSGLAVQDAVVRYGVLVALDHVCLTVAPGEVVALTGASGSGKTTLLRAIAGLQKLSSGRVLWDGQDALAVKVNRRGFGLVAQGAQLFPRLDVAANVGYGLPRMGREKAVRVAEALELFGLPGAGPRPVADLTNAEIQRVLLARAYAPRPRLLLLDEPLSSLEEGPRARLADTLAVAMRTAGMASVYVTHDHAEASRIADRTLTLANGRLA